MMDLQLKEVCPNMSQLNPRFVHKESVNEEVLHVFSVANKLNF